MLNVGPRGDGSLDPADAAILTGIGKWMAVNGESIHGTARTPLPVQAWGESTLKGNTLYLHVFHWPSNGELLVGGIKSNIKNAYLLSDSRKTPLAAERVGDCDVRIKVPSDAPDAVDSVVVVQCDGGEIACDSKRLLSASQPNVLRVFDGELCGETIKFGAGKTENAYIEQWPNSGDSICWYARVSKPTRFDVVTTYDAADASAGGSYRVTVGFKTLNGTIRPGKELSDRLGIASLEPGEYEIRVSPDHMVSGQDLMHLRRITLTAVGNETTSAR